MTTSPLLFQWDGFAGCMKPVGAHMRRARQQYQDGGKYALAEYEPRDWESHASFFATINDMYASCLQQAFLNLPEGAGPFKTPDELRKWALTHTGFRTVSMYRAASEREAKRMAKYLRERPDYTRVVFDEHDPRIVWEFIPRSQSYQSMSRREFRESKKAVLDFLAQAIGVSVDELREAGRNVA